jgi:hypothetical protein
MFPITAAGPFARGTLTNQAGATLKGSRFEDTITGAKE